MNIFSQIYKTILSLKTIEDFVKLGITSLAVVLSFTSLALFFGYIIGIYPSIMSHNL